MVPYFLSVSTKNFLNAYHLCKGISTKTKAAMKINEPIELNKLNFKCVYAEYNDIMRAHLGVNPFWIWHLLAKPLFRKIETLELKATSVNNG